MSMGPGKYDLDCTEVMVKNRAETVLLIVIGGPKGSGFSMTTVDPSMILGIPSILRAVADDIEKTGSETPAVQ